MTKPAMKPSSKLSPDLMAKLKAMPEDRRKKVIEAAKSLSQKRQAREQNGQTDLTVPFKPKG